jgi:uncharacterized protein (DUF111 family)
MAAWADRFAQPPALVPRAVGIGLGSRQLDRPNLLRVLLAEPLQASEPGLVSDPARLEPLLQQQAQIDDATAEDLAFLAEQLREAGAVEVFSQPVQMKKGRCGVLLTALAAPELGPALRQVWWRHGSSLGVREQLQQRWAQRPDGGLAAKPEYEDLAAIARRYGLPLAQVRQWVLALLETPETSP